MLQRLPEYARFVRHLKARGIAEFTVGAPAREQVGCFSVKKKGDRLRLILDCMQRNAHFRAPGGVKPCSGESLSLLSCEEADALGVDARRLLQPRPARGLQGLVHDAVAVGWCAWAQVLERAGAAVVRPSGSACMLGAHGMDVGLVVDAADPPARHPPQRDLRGRLRGGRGAGARCPRGRAHPYADNLLTFDTKRERAEAKVSAVMAELTKMGLEWSATTQTPMGRTPRCWVKESGVSPRRLAPSRIGCGGQGSPFAERWHAGRCGAAT